MISAAIRPIAIAAIASFALVGAAEAGSYGKSKSHRGYSGNYYYGDIHVSPSGTYRSYDRRTGKYQNFGSWPRDTSREGYWNVRRFDFDRGYY